MAAVTLSHNITRQEDFEGTPAGTINNTGGGPGAAAEAGLHYEASQCLARRIGASNADRGFHYTHGDIGTVNMTTTGYHCWLAKVMTALSAVINPAGTQISIGSSDTDTLDFQAGDDGTMGDNGDFALPAKGGYVITPVEMRVNAWCNDSRNGTPDITAVDTAGVIHNVSATTGAGTSQGMDSIDYTTDGLFLVGGDGATADADFQDFVKADQGEGLTGASRAGIWQGTGQGIIAYLNNVIGRTDTGTVTATEFTDSGFQVTFPGGFVSDGRNGLEFDLGSSTVTTTVSLSDGQISGRDRKYGGRSKIKRYFDTELDVNGTSNQITIIGHGFRTGDAVIYSAEGGTEDIGPDATTGEAEFYSGTSVGTGAYWYVIKVSNDVIQLASTAINAYAATPTATSLTASTTGNGENHSLTRAPDTRPNIKFVQNGGSGSASLTRVNLGHTRIITLVSSCTLTSCVISKGRQLILADATLDSCIIAEPTTSIGEAYLEAIHAQDLDEIDDSSFTSGGLGHAIEVTTNGTTAQNTAAMSNVSLSGYFAADADNTGGWGFDPDVLGSGGDVDTTNNDITITGHGFSDGDPVYYSDEGGTAIGGLTDQALYYVNSIDANTISLHLSDSAAIADSNRVNLTAGSTDTQHKLYSANAAFFNNTGGALTLNILNGGTSPTVRNSAGSTTTVNNSVTVTIAGVTWGTPVKVIANETVGSVTAGDLVSQGFADSNGEYEFSMNYEGAFGAGLDVLVRARNQGVAVAAIAEDNGTGFTDETEEASDSVTSDMTLLPATPAASDAYYFGHNEKFSRLKIFVSQVLTWTTTQPAFTWEYWNGSTWASLSGVSDGTSGFETSGDGLVSWTTPGDWATTTVNSQGPLYYVRVRLSTVGNITQVPKGKRAVLDVSRYLPYDGERTITSSGLADNASWRPDSISKFVQ